MKFAKYYNVTNKMNELLKKGQLFSYEKDLYRGLYICSDTHDFWISRILEGYNEEFEKEEGKWLIERNKIDKYEFCEFLKEKKNDKASITDRSLRDYYIEQCFSTNEIIENLILLDDKSGLEGWDNFECDSPEEAVDIIDGGYGIIQLNL